MIVECPNCSKANEIEFANNIICGECNSSFFGHVYRKYRKPFLSVTTALVIGAYGGYKVTDLADSQASHVNRYPMKVEYELVNTCLNSNIRSLTRASYSRKQEICLCAVEATAANLSYASMRGNPQTYLLALSHSVDTCNEGGRIRGL